MDIKIIETSKGKIASVSSNNIIIKDAQDMLDLIATVRYEHDCDSIIIPRACVAEPFFDLKTRIAGEALQKCVNYQVKIAIVGDFSGYTSKALRDFIYESNQGTTTFFLPTEAEAITALQKDK